MGEQPSLGTALTTLPCIRIKKQLELYKISFSLLVAIRLAK